MIKPGMIKRRVGVADDPTALRPTLREALDMVLEQAPMLIDGVLDGLARSVAQSQTSGQTGAVDGLVKQAVEQLAAVRNALRDTFAEQLREEIFSGAGRQRTGAGAEVRFQSLQLLAEDQLDESIEVARAQQEVDFAVDDVRPTLDALMSSQLGWLTVQPQINPLRPEVFVRALRAALASQISDTAVREAVLTPAAGRMGVALNKLYRETSDWLRSTGVEPAGLTIPTPGSARATAPQGTVARTLLTLERLRKLLSGELDDGTAAALGRGTGGQDFLHTVPASFEALQDMKQVEALVSRLAKKARQAAESGAPRAASPDLRDGRKLGKELGQEVVRLMVENLTQDERLLPGVRALLQVLEPTLLQMAQGDQRFFNDKTHPARRFLDRVTHRSLAFTSERDEGYARFLRTIEKAVHALAERSDSGQPALFGTVIDRLEAAWTRAESAERALRDEAARALVMAEQRNLLAQRLAEDFRERMDGRDIPAVVANLLLGPWAQVVAHSQLQGTGGTADPDGYLGLIDDLLWSVEPRVASRNRTRLVTMIPGMLARLRQGLKVVEYPPERIATFFDELIAIHEAALEGGRPKPLANEAERQGPSSIPDSHPPEDFWMAEREAEDSGFVDEDSVMPLDPGAEADAAPEEAPVVTQELQVGAWVELMLEGRWVRAQLSWASPHRTLFMFSSSTGEAHSMTRRTMDRLLAQGLLRVVAAGDVVEQALDAVAHMALRNTIGSGPGSKG